MLLINNHKMIQFTLNAYVIVEFIHHYSISSSDSNIYFQFMRFVTELSNPLEDRQSFAILEFISELYIIIVFSYANRMKSKWILGISTVGSCT